MKKLFLFLFWGALLSATPALAQKNTVSLSGLYLPVGGVNISMGALGYYRQWTPHRSIGAKGMYMTDALGKTENEGQFTLINIELVHRWTLGKPERPSRWHLDAGIATAWTIEKIPPQGQIWFCGTGLTQKELDEMQRYYEEVLSQWHVERKNFPGITTTANWSFRFPNKLSLGASLGLNVYFATKDGILFLPTPQVNAAYSF